MTRIVSSLPGRIRLRDPALRQPGRLDRLCAVLQGMDGVQSVAGNLKAGSIVVLYRPDKAPVETVETAVERAAEAEFARPRQGLKPSTRVQINRYAKRGMLVSLAVSLALAAAGNKRWHAVSGGVFVAFLLAHMTVHRRHLLR